MHFGKNNRKFKYQFRGSELEASEWEKDVGVIVSNDLKPSLQCSKAAAKANQVLGQISRGVTYRDKETLLTLLPAETTQPSGDFFDRSMKLSNNAFYERQSLAGFAFDLPMSVINVFYSTVIFRYTNS